ncbi:Nucleotide-binding universal stress protein, UspA family [Maridesulfovibrio ferrireducens]|uniref:Universal stress protein n=1 Tax=Maridesulfovibrio ferrireducens TaxID=246191 RepID=A0A1G9BMS0_9BACT|nr:universal stress protein [Maridesulfovibrio ferrireducens]SDK40809.1 Nucleotide-binding universal stress protein, UspA family [Maridesulfovibrio ferrireducens]
MITIKKILCAVDFSEHSPVVADYANTLAKTMGSKIICLYVAPSLDQYVGFHVPPSSIENFVGEIVTGADTTMETFIEENFKDAKVNGKVMTGYAAEEILTLAKAEEVDMIIMGTHGRRGIDRILFGSVAEKVVKAAKCPVLTVRPE